MKTAESKTTTTAATTAAKTPTAAFFSQEPQRATAFFGGEAAEAAPFFSPETVQPNLIQRQVADGGDTTHASPSASPSVAHVNITIQMPISSTDPAPNYSRDESSLGAWETAEFVATPQGRFTCDHSMVNGSESSFVTDVSFLFTQSDHY